MQETAASYSARLYAYVGDDDPVEMQRKAPETLAGLIQGLTTDSLTRQPATDKWSVAAILAHMAEDELVSSWRYRQMIENSGVTFARSPSPSDNSNSGLSCAA